MTKTGYKNILLALLLLAFTSQSFAALVMPCQLTLQLPHSMNMDDMAGMDHSNMAGMDHSGMTGDIKTHPTPMSDCCKTIGHCSSGGCSLAFFNQTFNLALASTRTDLNIFYTSVAPESLVASLYRPPIFR